MRTPRRPPARACGRANWCAGGLDADVADDLALLGDEEVDEAVEGDLVVPDLELPFEAARRIARR